MSKPALQILNIQVGFYENKPGMWLDFNQDVRLNTDSKPMSRWFVTLRELTDIFKAIVKTEGK
jgi:hypothetical protein